MNTNELNHALYKAQTELFNDDYTYYLNFCKGFKVLELFAGYGRLTNYLAQNNVDITVVEIEPYFAKFIKIPAEKIHITDVRTFETSEKFERIFAGYDSFCLLQDESDIINFFNKLSTLLVPGGIISLNYYHQDYWGSGNTYEFKFNGQTIQYIPDCDLSEIELNRGIWIDEYKGNGIHSLVKLPTRIYKDSKSLLPFIKNTDLKIVETIYDHNNDNKRIRGFVDFVLQKNN